MARLKLSPPWITYYNEVEAMFSEDPEVHVIYDEESNILKLYVSNHVKADALAQIMPNEKVFGNVTLKITVIPSNTSAENSVSCEYDSLYEAAFQNNHALSFVKKIEGIFAYNATYVVFKNKVVQYFNDNLADVYGNCSTLYQELAKDIFSPAIGVYFCTDVPNNLGKLLAHLAKNAPDGGTKC